MSRHGISALAVRITGIILAIYAASNSGFYYLALETKTGGSPWLWVLLTPFVMMITAAVLMIVFPRIVAGNLVPPVSVSDEDTRLSIADIELLACLVVGLYFLVDAGANVFYFVSYWIAGEKFGFGSVWSPDIVGRMVATVFEVFAAGWLLFGARGLVELLRMVRASRPGGKL